MMIPENVFLVTGGASGLGEACARAFHGLGGKVIAADVNREKGNALADELGEGCSFVECDVTHGTQVQQAIDLAGRHFGKLNGVLNCAGILGAARIVGRNGPHDLDLFKKIIEVNLIGTFNVIRLAATAMSLAAANEEGERGIIVTTASVAAFEGQIGQAAYSASKAGVAGMTLPIARELARFGIRIVAIAPGVFETPMMGAMPTEAQQALAAQVPFPPRLGKPAEYAALARHIVENVMLNGTTIRLDGAIRMSA